MSTVVGGTIFVSIECDAETVAPSAFEAIAVALHLGAEAGLSVSAGLAGPPGTATHAEALFGRGVDAVYVAEHETLREARPEASSVAIAALCRAAQSEAVIFAQTASARELAPAVAQRLRAGVVMNVSALSWSAGELEVTASVFGGAAERRYRFQGGPRVVGLQLGLEQAEPTRLATTGRVVRVDAGLDSFEPRTRLLRRSTATGPRLEDARVIVAGGLGLQKSENFTYVEQLADLLGGLPAASRPIVDKGWASPTRQIGLTGKVVTPDLYFALGISGASQHMAGCTRARTIVAVNTDAQAAIFSYARYGVVADCVAFLPAFIEECRRLVASEKTGTSA